MKKERRLPFNQDVIGDSPNRIFVDPSLLLANIIEDYKILLPEERVLKVLICRDDRDAGQAMRRYPSCCAS